MKKILTFGLATSALLIGSTQAQAATFLIDTFDGGSALLEIGPDSPPPVSFSSITNPVTTTINPATGAEGNTRDASLELDVPTGFAGSVFGQTSFGINNSNSGQYTHGNGTLDASTFTLFNSTAEIVYDAGDSGLDLDLQEFNTFSLDITTLIKEADIKVFVSDGINMAMAETTVSSIGKVSFSFSDFSSFDFSNPVESITLQTTLSGNSIVALDNFVATKTPEPAAVIGLLASLGFGALAKKKKQA